jgi:hypothetical protein
MEMSSQKTPSESAPLTRRAAQFRYFRRLCYLIYLAILLPILLATLYIPSVTVNDRGYEDFYYEGSF